MERIVFEPIRQPIMVDWARKIGPGSMPVYHVHDACEICYMIEGRRLFFLRNQTFCVEKGDLVLIGSNDIHRTVYTDNPVYERIVVNFKPGCLAGMAGQELLGGLLRCFSTQRPVLRLQPEERAQVLALLNRLHDETGCGGESALYRKALMAELIVVINRLTRQPGREQPEEDGSMQSKMHEIVQYINENYASRLTLEELSHRFYISRFHLSRQFRQETGFSFVEYLNTVRIREACRLLACTNEPAIAIAETAGYGSVAHFNRTFKAATGMSPIQYRKNNRGF